MSNLEIVEIEGEQYQLRTRLGWLEQARIDDSAFSMFVDGRSIVASDSLADIDELEIRMNRAGQALARLRARLVGIKQRDIPALPAAHANRLLERIAELEAEEREEMGGLAEENPIGRRLRDSSTSASSED